MIELDRGQVDQVGQDPNRLSNKARGHQLLHAHHTGKKYIYQQLESCLKNINTHCFIIAIFIFRVIITTASINMKASRTVLVCAGREYIVVLWVLTVDKSSGTQAHDGKGPRRRVPCCTC
jgi:hypothetical protein